MSRLAPFAIQQTAFVGISRGTFPLLLPGFENKNPPIAKNRNCRIMAAFHHGVECLL